MMARPTPGPWMVDPKYPLCVRPTAESTNTPGERAMVLATVTDLAGGGYTVPCYGEHNSDRIAMAKPHFGDSATIHPTITYEHAKANARLMAAAPELLDACLTALTLVDACIERRQIDLFAIRDQIEEAVAKVEGEIA